MKDIEYFAKSDMGLTRRRNEDCYLLSNLYLKRVGKGITSLLVSDGLGGHRAGNVASDMTCNLINTYFYSSLNLNELYRPRSIIDMMENVIQKANSEIFSLSSTVSEYLGMGATLTWALIIGNTGYFAQVGDSRGYHIGKYGIRQITIDQSFVQQLIDSGEITKEQARYHPYKYVVLQAIGIKDKVAPDFYEVTIPKGDCILLCSDGLTDSLTDEEIELCFRTRGSLKGIGDQLLKIALEKGGKDNITIVISRINVD